jgi:hypothetical protein
MNLDLKDDLLLLCMVMKIPLTLLLSLRIKNYFWLRVEKMELSMRGRQMK